MVKLIHRELAYKVVGCAMEVHKNLGPGFIESVYEEAFKLELNANGISFESQKEYPVIYRGQEIKKFYCDLVVENKIIIELKAIKILGNIERAQLINYLKVTGLKLGLLMNFGEKSLVSERLVSTSQNNN